MSVSLFASSLQRREGLGLDGGQMIMSWLAVTKNVFRLHDQDMPLVKSLDEEADEEEKQNCQEGELA